MSTIVRALLLAGWLGGGAAGIAAAAQPNAPSAATAAQPNATPAAPSATRATGTASAPPATRVGTPAATPTATATPTPGAATAAPAPSAATPAAGSALERGDFVMPKLDCRIRSGDREVPLKGRILPFVVQSVRGDEVEIGCGLTTAADLVRLDDAEAYYAECLRKEPRSVDAYHLRAMVRMHRRDYAGAVADLDAAIALIPTIARLYTKRAAAYFELRDPQTKKLRYPERVRENCVMATQYNRNEVWAYCIRLLLQAETNPGDSFGALEDYQRIQLIVPQDAESCQVRGVIFRTMQLPIQAIRDFDKAIDLEPSFARCYANRASANRLRGRKAEALRDYETAIRLSPKDIDGYVGRCSYYLAENQPQLAFADAEKALELAPRNIEVLAAFANSLCNVKDPALRDGARALKLATTAYEIDPADWRALNALGSAHAELRQFEKAEEYFRKALELKHTMSPNEAAMTAYFINRVRSGAYPEHD